MRAVAYDGYFSNGRFYVSGKTVNIPEKRRIVVTILDDILPDAPVFVSKKEVAKNFLNAMKEIRKNGFTDEENESINEFQSSILQAIE